MAAANWPNFQRPEPDRKASTFFLASQMSFHPPLRATSMDLMVSFPILARIRRIFSRRTFTVSGVYSNDSLDITTSASPMARRISRPRQWTR